MKPNFYIFLIITFLILFGCQSEKDGFSEQEVPSITETVLPVQEETAPAAHDTATSTPAQSAAPSAPKQTIRADSERSTVTAKPTPTPNPPTATPDHPPAPHINVGQPSRGPSDCSPDYPCNDDIDAWERRMRAPEGFEVNYFARVGGRPTAMTVGPEGNLYVAVITGTIYTIDDIGGVQEFFSGLNVPTGLAFQPDSDRLYFSSRLVDDNVSGEGQVAYLEDGRVVQVMGGLPCCYIGMHGPNGIAFGPDGFGYVGVGGRADHGEILIPPNDGKQDELNPLEASILRFSPDGNSLEVYARGFRNPYDIAWDADGLLYATDNGRDGNREEGENPPDELHVVIQGGEHGYPYYECENCFGIPADVDLISPLFELLPHSAAAGITAYLDDKFPGYYNDLFLVMWSAFEGAQKVQRVDRNRNEISDFATGFAAPIDIVVGHDGSLYIADFATGIIFRIRYIGGSITPTP